MSVCRLAWALLLLAWLAPLSAGGPLPVRDQRRSTTTDNPHLGAHGLGATTAGRGNAENDSPGNRLEWSDIGKTQVRFVGFLPPDKAGMTTGGPGDVTILINRHYPLFVQYSTLVHESVHARDRHLGISPHLSIAQREARALIVELSPANVLATTALAALTEGPRMQHRVTTFFQDVLAHYKRYSALAAMQARRPAEDTFPSLTSDPLPFLRTTTHGLSRRAAR